MIALRVTRRLAKQIMMNRAHAEAQPIFYSARKWREIHQKGSRCKKDGGATREEAMQQPTSTREAQRKERDGGMTRKEGVVWQGFARAAQQMAMQHDSK